MSDTTLSGRYELIERIGGGGMALVYKALDTLLNRFVAVKVLRQQYVHDDEFIRRFRREAQSAASLSHPNVVSVYDVGQDGDNHFIVMEYIEGSNLNEIIKEKSPMQVSEAVHIATQICDALSHAHMNGIIHRDIKPHNILIGKNGRVKVTDFGIARAITSSTITQTGSVIGSVHYFSPEHAKGVSAGEQSDLYSLGIVIYQMLTGRLPFLGESPISVALKHLQEPVEEPRSVNPMIPQSVENVILKAMRKRPEERYGSAADMLKDLETCLSPERLNEPKWTFASDEEEDEEATRIIPAIRPEHIASGTEDDDSPLEKQDTLTHLSTDAPVWRDGAYEEEEEEDRRNPWVKPFVWFGVLLVLIGAAWYGVNVLRDILIIPDVEVVDVRGKPYEEARMILEERGFEVPEPFFESSREVPENHVIDQSKIAGTLKKGSEIRLTVSSGIELVTVPSLLGYSESEAKEVLEDLGIPEDNILIKHENHPEAAPGEVLEQTPEEGAEIDPLEETFSLVVSLGPEEVPMPDLIGKTPAEAQAELERAGLTIDPDKNFHYEKAYSEAGKVYKQFPYEPGAMVKPPGEDIMIYISEGLPDEAAETIYTVEIAPSTPGTESHIRILVTDAMGDRAEAVNTTITSFQALRFPVVTSPTKNAVIEIFENDTKINQITWTHNNALQSGGSAGSPLSAPDAGGEAEPVNSLPAGDSPPPADGAEGQNQEGEVAEGTEEMEETLEGNASGG